MRDPLFSVVIPAYNRASTLARVLAAYEDQRPADLPFEVIVVDDGSTDSTLEVVTRFRSRRFTLRIATQANLGPARARNHGLGMVAAPLVLFTGDDIEPTSDLLVEHWRGHRAVDDPHVAVLGLTRWPPGARITATMRHVDVAVLGLTRWPPGARITATMRHVDGPGAQQFGYYWMRDGQEYDFRHFYTSNVSLRRTLLEAEPDGFSTDFPAAAWEDAELAYRLAGHGMRILFRSGAVAHHHHSYDVDGFFRRQHKSGQMASVLCRQQPALRKWTDADQLERLRLRLLTVGAPTRRRVARVADQLRLWERRALTFVGLYDHLDTGAVDQLLPALFRYAFLCGLARGMYDREQAKWLGAAVFVTLLPAAVEGAIETLVEEGLPFPSADVDRLRSLGSAGSGRIVSGHRAQPGETPQCEVGG
jgi:glycosyltransferase involved in cell wall biosynthesis